MKITTTLLFFIILLLTLTSPTLACIGAEAAGMGLAHVSAVDDVTAAYWNPAALAWVEPSIALGIQRDSPEACGPCLQNSYSVVIRKINWWFLKPHNQS